MKPGQKIDTLRDYERWLRRSGFSVKRSKILARAWRDVEADCDSAASKTQVPAVDLTAR